MAFEKVIKILAESERGGETAAKEAVSEVSKTVKTYAVCMWIVSRLLRKTMRSSTFVLMQRYHLLFVNESKLEMNTEKTAG